MHCSHRGSQKWVQIRGHIRATECGCRWIARFLLPMMSYGVFALPAYCQDSGSAETEFFGNGAEITVTVCDGSGESISSAAMVKLYRDGTIPSGRAETTRGRAVFVVNTLGEFTVIVTAPGYGDAQKEVSVRVPGRALVDVYLRRSSAAANTAGVPGRPVLAPKAREAVDKGLQALSANKTGEAEKYLGEAMRLAPGHPDVLYVQGVLCLKQRNWEQAQNALEKATQIDPSHARAFAALGMALCDQGKYDAAIAPLEKSLQLDSAVAWETRWALAKAYYQHGQYDEALKMSQEALAGSSGKGPEVGLLVAQSLTAVGRYEEAAQVLREFLSDHADRREAATARRWLERLTASGKIRAN
jgi:Flp pilus assembly protein TadD